MCFSVVTALVLGARIGLDKLGLSGDRVLKYTFIKNIDKPYTTFFYEIFDEG